MSNWIDVDGHRYIGIEYLQLGVASAKRLRLENKRLSDMNEKYNIRAGEDATELAKLRGENERLRADNLRIRELILEEAEHNRGCPGGLYCSCWHDVALAGKEQGNG